MRARRSRLNRQPKPQYSMTTQKGWVQTPKRSTTLGCRSPAMMVICAARRRGRVSHGARQGQGALFQGQYGGQHGSQFGAMGNNVWAKTGSSTGASMGQYEVMREHIRANTGANLGPWGTILVLTLDPIRAQTWGQYGGKHGGLSGSQNHQTLAVRVRHVSYATGLKGFLVMPRSSPTFRRQQ